MQMNLEIDNKFPPHFKSIIDSFVKYDKISVLEMDEYDYTKNLPESMIVSSVEEVRRRVALAEERVLNGEYLTEKKYEQQMDAFFEKELGIKR